MLFHQQQHIVAKTGWRILLQDFRKVFITEDRIHLPGEQLFERVHLLFLTVMAERDQQLEAVA